MAPAAARPSGETVRHDPHRGSALLRQPDADIGRADGQQWAVVIDALTLPARGHGAQAGQTGAAAQGQQQCLHLVVSMLRNCYRLNSWLRNIHGGYCLF